MSVSNGAEDCLLPLMLAQCSLIVLSYQRANEYTNYSKNFPIPIPQEHRVLRLKDCKKNQTTERCMLSRHCREVNSTLHRKGVTIVRIQPVI